MSIGVARIQLKRYRKLDKRGALEAVKLHQLGADEVVVYVATESGQRQFPERIIILFLRGEPHGALETIVGIRDYFSQGLVFRRSSLSMNWEGLKRRSSKVHGIGKATGAFGTVISLSHLVSSPTRD